MSEIKEESILRCTESMGWELKDKADITLLFTDKSFNYHSISIDKEALYYEAMLKITKGGKKVMRTINSLNTKEPIGKYFITDMNGRKYLNFSTNHIFRTDDKNEELMCLLNYVKKREDEAISLIREN